MYSNYESYLLLQLIDDFEPGILSIITYYMKTYTFNFKKVSKLVNELKETVGKWCDTRELCEKNYGHISYWDVSKINDMCCLFLNKTEFNDNISRWDVANVVNMSYMFNFAQNFNQPLNSWDVSNVENINYMFNYAISFNQPLNTWNISKVTTMKFAFTFTRSLRYDNIIFKLQEHEKQLNPDNIKHIKIK